MRHNPDRGIMNQLVDPVAVKGRSLCLRPAGQMDHVVERTVKRHPGARAIIYAGSGEELVKRLFDIRPPGWREVFGKRPDRCQPVLTQPRRDAMRERRDQFSSAPPEHRSIIGFRQNGQGCRHRASPRRAGATSLATLNPSRQRRPDSHSRGCCGVSPHEGYAKTGRASRQGSASPLGHSHRADF